MIRVSVAALALGLSLSAPSYARQDEAGRLDQKVIGLYQAGKYAAALPLAQRSLALRERALGPNHLDVATSLNDLDGELLTLGTVLASAQQRLTPEQKADSDALRALTKVVPLLPMERIELKPTAKLEGISALAADKQGNIYVIHRPTDPNGDPIVVLDAKGAPYHRRNTGLRLAKNI